MLIVIFFLLRKVRHICIVQYVTVNDNISTITNLSVIYSKLYALNVHTHDSNSQQVNLQLLNLAY